ncbi:transcriptional regulator, TetR family [Rhizobium freirei PRF 81]|uniref:Transcriptional regulator, TetR family n=2 Tax=Rhizobium freirei TaxID=1353277 RepID=N6TW85_9HYPH|nr:transcriptional regulator, TetR family [Rhizobium freirei PRF 81]
MAQKRASILRAAKECFLNVGYEGASMESIAAGANVSIMTLYRHADSKDDLFEAVISAACEHKVDVGPESALIKRPLRELLLQVADLFQERLSNAETLALLRAVMIENQRFPKLAEAAYEGFIEAWKNNLEALFSHRVEFADISVNDRKKMLSEFIDGLIGADILRLLLGGKGLSGAEKGRRAEAATDTLVAKIS